MSTLSLRLPNSLHHNIKLAAEKDGVSINQFISLAVAEKLSALQAFDLIAERVQSGAPEPLARVPTWVPAAVAEPGEEP